MMLSLKKNSSISSSHFLFVRVKTSCMVISSFFLSIVFEMNEFSEDLLSDEPSQIIFNKTTNYDVCINHRFKFNYIHEKRKRFSLYIGWFIMAEIFLGKYSYKTFVPWCKSYFLSFSCIILCTSYSTVYYTLYISKIYLIENSFLYA